MTSFITLTCPTCGAKLEIADEDERFACIHCGNEHVVKRGGGKVSLKPVIESIGKVQMGVDKTASELAIKRLESEISELESQILPIGKAINASTIIGYRPNCNLIIILYLNYKVKKATTPTGKPLKDFIKSFEYEEASSIKSYGYDEMNQLSDYFLRDPNETIETNWSRPPKKLVRSFLHIRKLLEPYEIIRNKLETKKAELRRHHQIVSHSNIV